MNPAKLAIKRPIFITCIVLIIIIIGAISYRTIPLELFPDVSFPTVGVTTVYSGASPTEIETLITKPLEDELGSLEGLKHINSTNIESYSSITLEFNMDIDVDKAAQDVRDKIDTAMNNLPDDLENDPVVMKFDPDATAVITLALTSDLPKAKIYDLANEVIKPQLARLKDVGNVTITGGTKREIQVEIDQRKLRDYDMSMTSVVSQIKSSGENVPIGKKEHGSTQTVFRSMGDYTRINDIGKTLLAFSGDLGNSVSVDTLGEVKDGLEDVTSEGYIYFPDKKTSSARGIQSCVYLSVVKQSGKNTVTVTDGVREKIKDINEQLKGQDGNSSLFVTHDQSEWIRTNVDEAILSIVLGIILAVFVVYLFLGNVRSTIITAVAIPNSLLGAVIVMNFMGYSFNIMTLMALSLVVGLLVDDAIVVRENIFRKLETGMDSHKAAEIGTTEVMLAVIATTLAIIAVFFPIGMLSGAVGKMFKQFGFTVIFAMMISTFDALTVAPFLSAYFAGSGEKSANPVIRVFMKLQDRFDIWYEKLMHLSLRHPIVVITATVLVFFCGIILLGGVKKTFFPRGDRGQFSVNIEMPPGTSLQGTRETLEKIEDKIRTLRDLEYYSVSVGNSAGEAAKGSINIVLKDERKHDTDDNMLKVRSFMKEFDYARPSVDDAGSSKRGAPFIMIVSGNDLLTVEDSAGKILEAIKTVPGLIDIDSSMKPGSPELRVNFNPHRMQALGVANTSAGIEMRYNITGAVVGTFKENSYNYDIRARLRPEQRDLRKLFYSMQVPNVSGKMINLSSIAAAEMTTGSAEINRRNKAYIVKITANLAAGEGVGSAMEKVQKLVESKIKLPEGVAYSYSGSSENFAETADSIVFALLMAILFIYLVLASLYESFVTPFTILLAIPPAITGAFFSLYITGFMLDIFSMIGMIMLVGLVTKNSILLVDNAVQGINSGLDRKEAILQAGIRRLRPILMTTFAMIAGMVPLAMGIGKAAQMRQSMGISIIGGIVISTLVTLVAVPAVFGYIDRFRSATEARIIVRKPENAAKKKKG